jgi:hypothetical protein
VLRFLGVPGVVVGYQGDKAATYASADAFFEKGGVKHCILPLVTNMEQRDELTLLVRGDPHYIKRNLDVLQRANTKDRFASLVQATGGPFMAVNEARAIEDMNPDPNPDFDQVRWPANVAGKDTPTDPTPTDPSPAPKRRKPEPPPADEEDAAAALAPRGAQFAIDAAARVLRREVAAVRGVKGSVGLAGKFAKDPAGWEKAVRAFYQEHAAHVAEVLHLTRDAAAAYVAGQRDELLAGGVGVMERWEAAADGRPSPRVLGLAAVALGEDDGRAGAAIAGRPIALTAFINNHNHLPTGPAPVVKFEPKITAATPKVEVEIKPADVHAEFHHHSTTHVEAPAPAPPSGPQQIEIIGPVDIGKMPLPAPTTTRVTETDKSGRIRATRTAPEE